MGDFSKRSITLVELLVALALIGLLAVGISSLDTYARFHLITSDRRAQLQNEASFCIERIVKDVSRGIGRLDDPAVQAGVCTADELQIRYDDNDGNPDGWIDPTDTADPIDGDKLVRFYRNGSTLEYYPDYGRDDTYYEILTNRVVNHLLSPQADLFSCSEGSVRIGLFLRYQPTDDESVDNPQLQMLSRVYCRSESLR